MISIIVLSYNHGGYIVETLRSVCEINIEKEIIIIDDGSTDDSINIINGFIRSCDIGINIRLIEKSNSGLVTSLNLGLNAAKGESIYFIASDDLVCPDDFSSMYEDFISNQKAQMIIGNAWVYYAGMPCSKKSYTNKHNAFFSLSDSKIRKEIFLDFPKPLLLQTVIFKRKALLDIGGWDENLIWDDYPMFVKLLSKYSIEENEIIYDPSMLVAKYRQHDTNSYKNTAKQLAMLKQTFEKLTPPPIFKKALAKQYAFYFLVALRNKDYTIINKLLVEVYNNKTFFVFTCSLFKQVIEWMKRKL